MPVPWFPRGMEPRLRWRRSSRSPVSAFLRDPGSGRVYKRGKLIGKVGIPASRVRSQGAGPGGGLRWAGGLCIHDCERRAGVHPAYLPAEPRALSLYV